MQSNQPSPSQPHEIHLQEQRIERELEDRRLDRLRDQLRRMILDPASQEQPRLLRDSQAA